MPVFSVIVPTYNRATLLPRALDSVRTQSFEDWELLIIDDASTDHTPEILKSYRDDSRIRIITNDRNMERSASRNKGMKEAKGRYLCFLDSDDYYAPLHLETLYKAIITYQEPVALFHTDTQVVDERGDLIRIDTFSYLPDQSKVEAVLRHHIPTNTVAVHHELTQKFAFDPELLINEDVCFFAQCVASSSLVHVPAHYTAWTLHEGNTAHVMQNVLLKELKATDKIMSDTLIKPQLSRSFKKQKYGELYTRLVYWNAVQHKHGWSVYYFLRHLILQPLDPNNKNNLLNVLYHLPGGNGLKQWMNLWNK